jgi:hypothetical protein
MVRRGDERARRAGSTVQRLNPSRITKENRMKTSKLLVAMVCCGLTGVAMAQDQKPKAPESVKKAMQDAKEQMQPADKKDAPAQTPSADDMAWMKAGEPGEMHKWIAKSEGSWDATVKMMMPGMPPSESKATMTTMMVFGGRYAHSSFKGDFMGMPFEGVATLGFNNSTGKFEGTWMDSMSTATMYVSGTMDSATKAVTMSGEFMDPSKNKMVKQRQVTTWKNDNEFTDEFYHSVDGKESKVMEISYTRAKAAAKEKSAMDKAKEDMEKLKKDVQNAIPGQKK